MEIKTLKDREKDHLLHVLEKTHWNIQKTAGLLKITPSEVGRKIRQHGLRDPRGR
jgi:transcriptional regulator of acetoin/glycerol metabolism